MYLKTRNKKVSVGTLSTSSGFASQVKRDVASRRGVGALKEKNLSDLNGPSLKVESAPRSKKGCHS